MSEIKDRLRKIDIEIGRAIYKRRRALKLSQTELGKEVGVSFQQIRKYETAQNRVSASSLLLLAEALEMEIGEFYGKNGH